MTYQLSEAVRNAQAAAVESTIGTGPTLEIWEGTMPGSCAGTDTGTKLVSMSLPSDWLTPAANGSVSKLGTWSGLGITGGVASYFRVIKAGVCHMQGSVSESANTGDAVIDDVNITTGATVRVLAFSHYQENA